MNRHQLRAENEALHALLADACQTLSLYESSAGAPVERAAARETLRRISDANPFAVKRSLRHVLRRLVGQLALDAEDMDPDRVDLATERLLRAQVEHAGLDWDELTGLVAGGVTALWEELEDHEEPTTKLYSAVMHLAVGVAATVNPRGLRDISWQEALTGGAVT